MFRVFFLLGLWCLVADARASGDLVEQGRRLYQQGVLPDGRLLVAEGAGGLQARGAKAACVQCHRRSGMGSHLGRPPVPPITGPLLFSKSDRSGAARPAYDTSSAMRAFRQGIDAHGLALNSLMPRYNLDARASQALIAYLRQLSVGPVAGIKGRVLHLATVITADADPLRSRVLTDTLTAWARASKLGGLHVSLQVWHLAGPASTWMAQLQSHYRQTPVFAVLSGAGRADWAPVRDFCEQTELPCLFPLVDLATTDEGDNYTRYFSPGVSLEASLLFNYLDDLPDAPDRIVQLVEDEAGARAASQLTEQLGELPNVTRVWSDGLPASLTGLVEDLGPGDRLIAWLRPQALKALADALPGGLGGDQILLSEQLAPPAKLDLPPAWRPRTAWVSARSDPQRLTAKHARGLRPWLKRMGQPIDEESLQSEIYAAAYFFADAFARMHGHWSREYLLENLEIAPFSRPAGGIYYALSLGPGQAVAAKGGYLLGYAEPGFKQIRPVSPRLYP